MLTLISHQWKENFRSSIWTKNLAVNILFGLLFLYFALSFLILGIFLDEILHKVYPYEMPFVIFSGVLFYYFSVDIIIRVLMQDLPVLKIKPYLHLPIKRSNLVHYVLLKSGLTFLNFFPLLFIVPFAIREVASEYGAQSAWVWGINMVVLMLASNYLGVFVKRIFNVKPAIVLPFLLVLAGVIYADIKGWFNIAESLSPAFQSLVYARWMWVPPALLAFGYFLNYQSLRKVTYLDEAVAKKIEEKEESDFKLVQQLGRLGEWINLELKLIRRNKRPRSASIVSFFFLFYGLIFYTQDLYLEMYPMLIFVGIFVTGAFMVTYGQYFLSWESGHFDFILTRNESFRDFFLAKWWLVIIPSCIAFLLTLPYAFFGWHVLYINIACFLFNIGVNSLVLLYSSTFNKKRIDLSQAATMNFQGVGITQFVVALPILVLPILMYLPFGLMGHKLWGIIFIGVMGVLGIIFRNFLISFIEKQFLKRRHIISTGFKQS